MTLTSLVLPTFKQMLSTLSGWLDRTRELPAGEADRLLLARLAPDMFPLATQIRFACVQAWEAVSRLRNEEFSAATGRLLDEGRNADERPGTLVDAQARIAETIAMLDNLGPDALDGDLGRTIAHRLPSGMIFDLTAEQYARDWALPQFYFHLMTSYAILRSRGVALGKADYVAHMFAYLRPETSPVA